MNNFKEKCQEFLNAQSGMNCSNCVYGQTVYTLDEINIPNHIFEYIPNVYYCLHHKKIYGKLHTCNEFIDLYKNENMDQYQTRTLKLDKLQKL